MYPLFALFELPLLFVFLLFGGLGAYATYSVEKENFGGATTSLVVTLALLHMAGIVNVIALFAHPLILVGVLAAYLLIGVLWSVGKWKSHLIKRRAKIVEDVAAYRERYFRDVNSEIASYRAKLPINEQVVAEQVGSTADIERSKKALETLPASIKQAEAKLSEEAFQKALKDSLVECKLPGTIESMGKITGWAVYWVPSLIWFVIDEPVRRTFKAVIHAIGGLLDSIRSGEQKKLDNALSTLGQ